MTNVRVLLSAAAILGVGGVLTTPVAAAAPTAVCRSGMCTSTFAPGTDTFVVPDGLNVVDVVAVSGPTPSTSPLGTRVTTRIPVEGGDILTVVVAGGADNRTVQTTRAATPAAVVVPPESTVSRGTQRLVVAGATPGASSGGDVTATADAATVTFTYVDPSTIPGGKTCSGWGCLFDS